MVVFAQGRIGLCSTAGAKLMGASLIIGVESDPMRMKMAKQMGADVVLDPKQSNLVAEVKRLTGGGADVAIEALGLQETFENALRSLRPGGTLSSLGVYSGKLQVPYDAFAAGIGDYKIVTTLCPWRQGTDAAINGDGTIETVRSNSTSYAYVFASTRLSKLTISSARGVTAF